MRTIILASFDYHGHPMDTYTPIFAIAAMAGWLAHWLEQMKIN